MSKDNRTSKAAYPAEMRNQLWPLCCGAQILSGFKAVGNETHEELVTKINDLCDNYIADHQVYAGETMRPTVVFLTLNGGQVSSPKIMAAITEAGFVQFGKGTDRGSEQGFFVRNKSGAFKLIVDGTVTPIKKPATTTAKKAALVPEVAAA